MKIWAGLDFKNKMHSWLENEIFYSVSQWFPTYGLRQPGGIQKFSREQTRNSERLNQIKYFKLGKDFFIYPGKCRFKEKIANHWCEHKI